jgi:hypothetical protein
LKVLRRPLKLGDCEVAAGRQVDAELEAGAETEVEAGAETEAEAGGETEVEAGAETEVEAGAETEVEPGADSEVYRRRRIFGFSRQNRSVLKLWT